MMWVPIRKGTAEKLEFADALFAEGITIIRKVKKPKVLDKKLDWIPAAYRMLLMLNTALTPDERKAVRKFLIGAQTAYDHMRKRIEDARDKAIR